MIRSITLRLFSKFIGIFLQLEKANEKIEYLHCSRFFIFSFTYTSKKNTTMMFTWLVEIRPGNYEG